VRDVEDTDLGAAARVTVADDDDRAAGDQHFVVPRAAQINVLAPGIDRRHRSQLVVADPDEEQAPAPQDDQMFAVQFDDAALVHTGMLNVGDRLDAGRPGFLGDRRRRPAGRAAALVDADAAVWSARCSSRRRLASSAQRLKTLASSSSLTKALSALRSDVGATSPAVDADATLLMASAETRPQLMRVRYMAVLSQRVQDDKRALSGHGVKAGRRARTGTVPCGRPARSVASSDNVARKHEDASGAAAPQLDTGKISGERCAETGKRS